MADTAAPALTRQSGAAPSGQNLMETVARKAGVGPFRQFLDIRKLKGGENRLTAREYYDYQVYLPDLPMAAKKEFVGENGSYRLNLRLSPPGLTGMRGFLSDKLALTTLFGAWGLPVTEVQAVYSTDRNLGTLTTLRSADDIAAWLPRAAFPVFGKPLKGCQARGSVWIEGVTGDLAHLAGGQDIPLARLAAEIAGNTEQGYLFQSVVEQHPEIAQITGSHAVSTVRLVTVVEDRAPRVLYALWKLASPQAVSDNFWQAGSLISLLDAETDRVETCRKGSGPATEWVERHPVTGEQVVGRVLPNFAAARDLALAAHGAFPVNGILGWDIALTPGGACLIECNENTGHGLYQHASGRGILNAGFRPVFDRIIARNQARAAAFDAGKKAHLKAKAAF